MHGLQPNQNMSNGPSGIVKTAHFRQRPAQRPASVCTKEPFGVIENTHTLDKQQRNAWRVYAPDHPVGEKMHMPDNNIVALENM